MNLGRPLTLLIIILIAFGYLLSDDFHVRKSWNEARIQLVDTNENLANCERTVKDNQLIISGLEAEKSSLNNEIQSLQVANSQQASQIAELEDRVVKAAPENNDRQIAQPVSAWLQLDPILLAAMLVVQLVLWVVQRKQKNDYVRLSPEERAHIIRRRLKKT